MATTAPSHAAAGNRLVRALKSALPHGGLLPAPEWDRRHRGLLAWLWVSTIVLVSWSLLSGYGVVHTLEHAAAMVPFAVAASMHRFSRRVRSAFVSLGLLTSAALLVHITSGVIETHFYFFVLIVALTLYEDWLPFLLAVGFVLLHHGIVGTLVPEQVYNHPDAVAHPWLWAGIHASFVALAGIAGVLAWRLNEKVREHMYDTQRELAELSVTDSLTGLPNRRQAMEDLETIFGAGAGSTALLLLDLNGFKTYNDTFGHPAGDALLARLGRNLGSAVAGGATAYRLGGDEFCVIGPAEDRSRLEEVSCRALSETGRAFVVSTSVGTALVPSEARTRAEAMRLADRRLYADKGSSRVSAMSQSRDVLLRALIERHPDLEHHVDEVGAMVATVGNALGMPRHEVDQLRVAAELHDVGKVAIPDAILQKPGPLTDEEWAFMRQHTEIGQRIVDAAPALGGLGKIIRSSHERWDGGGYPDKLSGLEIPLGARIVAVADAYDAMTSNRPYRDAMTREDALAELQRCAGGQFDPDVVEAFESAVDDRNREAPLAVPAAKPVGIAH